MAWQITVLQQLINGLAVGSIYALIALGYTMVYGIIKLINFAHGEIYMLGAYFGFYAISVLKLSLLPAILLSMGAAALVSAFGKDRLQATTSSPRSRYLLPPSGPSCSFRVRRSWFLRLV